MLSQSYIKIIALFLLLSLGPASIYFLYARTGGLESRRELAFHRNIRFEFMAGKEMVDLSALTDWEWVRVCAIKGGLKQKEVDDLIDFSYENFTQLTWRALEDHWTLLFIDVERETNWGRHRPVIPIRIPSDDIADYDFGEGRLGDCSNKAGAALSLSRRTVSLGRTPIVARLVNSTTSN